MVPTNGLADGLYLFNNMVYSSTGGVAMLLAVPQNIIVSSTKIIKVVKTSGISEEIFLKALCIARGDKVSEVKV